MAYLGSTPTTQSFISGTDYFNGTGSQTAFTLTRSVASVNDIQAVVNNVVQVPNDAYTLSGTTITFTSAPSSGTNNVYVRYLSTTTQTITPSSGINLSAAIGTAGAPSYSFIGDSNTGIFSPAADTIAFAEGGTEVMRIDSSGRVTMPYQPSFHVRVNSAAYLNTSPVPFTNVVFDVGSNFNTSTYRFTAPIAGKYFLVLNMYLAADVNKDGFPRFNVNGSFVQYSYLYQTAGGTIHNTVAINRIFNLSVGDYVDVGFAGSGTYYGGIAETNFYGWLIG